MEHFSKLLDVRIQGVNSTLAVSLSRAHLFLCSNPTGKENVSRASSGSRSLVMPASQQQRM